MNNWISLNLIHKLKSIVAPVQCPHEIFTHGRNTCDFSHAGVHFHFLLLLPSSLVQCWVKSVLLRTVANTFEQKCAHTVLTVQRTDKYSQSHSLCFTRLTSTWTRTVPDAAHLLLQTVLQIPLRKKKRTGIIFSLLFSVFRLFSLRSRQLLSRRASHFSQILFSPFCLGCLCCLR